MIGNHKNLMVWQKSVDFVLKIYEITKFFPKIEYYGLISQLQKAAVSVPSNIAEGASRNTKAEYIHFLYIARGSVNEIDTQLEIIKRLKYINEEKYLEILEFLDEVSKMLNGLINSLKKK